MKVSKSILESIIRRTLMEAPLPRGDASYVALDDSEESQYNAAYGIVKTLFGPNRFDVILSRAGGKVLQSVMVRSMAGRISVYFPKMVKNMQKVITSGGFHSRMIEAANSQIDSIVVKNPGLAAGAEVAKRSVGYLIKAIFSLNIAEESFFALLYRFYPPTDTDFAIDVEERADIYGRDAIDLLRLSPEEGTVPFSAEDFSFIGSPEGMKSLARKVFDQVTKFYRHHDEYDDKMYEAYDLHFGVAFGDDDYLNFDTDWRADDLEL
jgi:hypothetical protein